MPVVPVPKVTRDRYSDKLLHEVDRMNAQIELVDRRARAEVLDRIDKANDGNKGSAVGKARPFSKR